MAKDSMTSQPADRSIKPLARTLMSKVFSYYVVIAASVTLIQIISEFKSAEENLRDNLKLYQQTFSRTLASAVWVVDRDQIKSTLKGMLEIPIIIGVSIKDENNQKILHSQGQVQDESGNYVTVRGNKATPAHFPGGVISVKHKLTYVGLQGAQVVGFFTLYSNKRIAFEKVHHNIILLIINSIVKTIALWLIFLKMASGMLGDPLRVLTRLVVRLKKDSFQLVEGFSREELDLTKKNDEIGLLAKSFFKMLGKLNEIHSRLIEYNETLELKVKEKVGLLKKSQEQLIQSEKQAALGHLVAGLAHEINTPIGIALTSATEIIERNKVINGNFNSKKMTKKDLEAFFRIIDEICHMVVDNLTRTAALVSSFKEVASDQASYVSRIFQVKKYLEKIIQSLKPELRKYSPEIFIDCADHIIIDSYPGPFAQVITNLLINSLIHGYNAESGRKIWIKVTESDSLVCIVLRDEGRGISEEDLKKIFDPFFTTRRGEGGTGLGLSIVFNIVKHNLGGDIQVASRLSEFSEFTVNIPKKYSTE